MTPNRIHLISHANPLGPDVARFGFADVRAYVGFIRQHLPDHLRLTYNRKLLAAVEDEWHGGRNDDALRVRDLQAALSDPQTLAIVASNGGGYFSRLLPHIDFSVLARRRTPLWALGFSELTTLVNHVAHYRCGRGLYWLCPNWLAYRIRPPQAAQAALAEFCRTLPELLQSRTPHDVRALDFGPIRGECVHGRVRSGTVRLIGGCLAVLVGALGGPLGRQARPDGKWLLLEDVKETPYRLDRFLAALKLAGWFERVAGVLIGDFRMMHADTQPAVVELLRYHLPAARRVPVVTTRSFGHVWPMVPVLLNRPVKLAARRRAVTVWAAGLDR
jgi:muramoyltetrapeptide carboxypeptidase